MLTEKEYGELIKNNQYHLLGEIPVDDVEYEQLLEYSRGFLRNVSPSLGTRVDLRLSITLVQIAIREYKEGKYWSYFCEAIGESVSSNKMNYCGKVFAATAKFYGLLYVNREDSSAQMYVENIKLHSIVTNYYMRGFYDFIYSYYEKNLLRQLTDDIDDDLESLSAFMQTTLEQNADSIVGIEGNGRAAKSYRLLKSTRMLLANGDLGTIREVLLPVLTMIDNYYYDSELPSYNDRFTNCFSMWTKEQEQSEVHAAERKENRLLTSKKPYIYIDFEHMISYLSIPSQKFRDSECDGEATARIIINGYEKNIDLEIYKSFGIYLSEKIDIPIPSIFDDIEVYIESNVEKRYRVFKSNYRILNKNYICVNKLVKEKNLLLVAKETPVLFENENDCIDYSDEYNLFDFYSINVSDESVIHIGKKSISLAGEYSEIPDFEDVIEEYEIYDSENNKLIVTRKHPTISFVVSDNKIDGTVLVVNDSKIPISKIENRNIYPANQIGEKAVVITLEDVLPQQDGSYDICIDIPDEKNKNIPKYVRLSKLEAGCSKSIYGPSDEIYVWVKHAHEYSWTDADNVELVGIVGNTDQYKVENMDGSIDAVSFNLDLNEELKLKIPLFLFKRGFSESAMDFVIPEYIWYTDLQDTIYCHAPEVEEVRVYLNHDKDEYVSGVNIGNYVFRVDISNIKRKICSSANNGWFYINASCRGKRNRSFPLYSVLRTLWVEPYFDISKQDGRLCFNLNVSGDAKLVVDIEDEITKEKLVTNLEINSGITYLPQLSETGLYAIFPSMIEEDDFGLSSTSSTMRCLYNQSYVGMDNLVGYRLSIADLLNCDEKLRLSFDYFLDIREKVNDTSYVGNMYGLKLSDRSHQRKGSKQGRYEYGEDGKLVKKRMGKILMEIIDENDKSILIKLYTSTYSEDDGWIELYYDNHFNTLLHCNDKILDSHYGYGRFVFLDQEETSFRIMKKKIRRLQKNVI